MADRRLRVAVVVAEVVLDEGVEAVAARRSWMWASHNYAFVWNGDTHVGISQTGPQVHDAFEADNRFTVGGAWVAAFSPFVPGSRRRGPGTTRGTTTSPGIRWWLAPSESTAQSVYRAESRGWA